MPVGFEERIRLVEEHALGVFMNARTAATLLGAGRDEVSGLVDLAESGALELSDLGLDAEALGEAAVRIGDEAWHDPESAAVRAAYVALAANREAVLEAVRGNAPAPRP